MLIRLTLYRNSISPKDFFLKRKVPEENLLKKSMEQKNAFHILKLQENGDITITNTMRICTFTTQYKRPQDRYK